VHGQADQHWLAAEREILATSTPALAREPASKKKRHFFAPQMGKPATTRNTVRQMEEAPKINK
jgi:hypothetical protein